MSADSNLTSLAVTNLYRSDSGQAGGTEVGMTTVCGTTELDGGNPTNVVTGLSTVVGFVAGLRGTAAPGVGTSHVTWDAATDGTVPVYAWKPTSAADPTLIASTGTETIEWIAVGTV